MTVGGLVDTVFHFNRLCECHLYTAPSNKTWPKDDVERVVLPLTRSGSRFIVQGILESLILVDN